MRFSKQFASTNDTGSYAFNINTDLTFIYGDHFTFNNIPYFGNIDNVILKQCFEILLLGFFFNSHKNKKILFNPSQINRDRVPTTKLGQLAKFTCMKRV